MRLVFSEEHAFFERPGTAMVYPMLPVGLVSKQGRQVDTFALLDSGADVSMFNAMYGERIGLDIQTRRIEHIGSIDGGLECFMHRIRMIVGSNRFDCEVAFSYELGEDIYDQLIGRDVVFDGLQLGLRQRQMRTYLAPER